MKQYQRRMVLAWTLSAAALLPAGLRAQGTDHVKIMMIQPLTGTSGQFGLQSLHGAQIAQQIINGNGGILGRPVDLIEVDDASDKTQAATLMKKYAPDDSVLAIIGPTGSGEFIATAPIAEQYKVVYISAGSAADWPGTFNEWTFRSSVPGSAFLPALVKALAAKGNLKTAAQVWTIDEAATVSQAKTLATLLPQNGITISTSVTTRTNATDYSSQVNRIMASPPDLVTIGMISADGALFMQQMRASGYKGRFVAMGTSLLDPSLFELSHGAADGMLVGAAFDPGDPAPTVQAFNKAFLAKFGKLPTSQDAVGYDALALIADAAKRAGTATDRRKLRDALGATKGFLAVTGEFTFAGKGDNTTPTIHVLQLGADGFKSY